MASLTQAVFHVLLTLAGGECHGYGILKAVLEQTGGAVRLGPGTLYGTLQRLMEQGWVVESGKAAHIADERRRYYRLTPGGRAALEAEVARMDALVRAARAQNVRPKPARS
jgi:DNA-binding PadR family transcriptional regulator